MGYSKEKPAFDPPTEQELKNIQEFKAKIKKSSTIRNTEFSKLNNAPTNGFSDFMKELVVPTTYVKGLFGAEQPVTMDSYPTDSQNFLRHIVRNNGEGPVGWGQWAKQAKSFQVAQSDDRMTPDNTVDLNLLNFDRPVSDQFFHPINQVHNTLGRFNVGVDPKTTEYIVNDRFNFEKDDATHTVNPGDKWWDPRFPLAKLGNLVIPESKEFSFRTGVFQNETDYDKKTGRSVRSK